MSATPSTRGSNGVLGILAGLDLLTAFYGFLYASVVTSTSPATWPWFAWLFAAAVWALPIFALVAPFIAWMNHGWDRMTRLGWAVAPLVYATLLSIAIEIIKAGNL